MTAPPTTTTDPPKHGQPRSPADAAALATFNEKMALPLVLSAVLPLLLLPGGSDRWVAGLVFIAAWVVFLIDLVVHERRLVHYLATWIGRFDLVVVVLTAPWFIFFGTGTGKYVVLIRLARVARLVMATRGARRLFARVGAVALVAIGVIFIGAEVAYHAERATNPEFKTYGDALWWAVVTLTTVGYGDIVPITTTGRVDGVVIMFAGVAVLGLLAGSLASFFGVGAHGSHLSPTTDTGGSSDAVAAELASLRAQVERLVDAVGGASPPPSTDRLTPPGG